MSSTDHHRPRTGNSRWHRTATGFLILTLTVTAGVFVGLIASSVTGDEPESVDTEVAGLTETATTTSTVTPRELTRAEILEADITELQIDSILPVHCQEIDECENARTNSFGQWVCGSNECSFDGSEPLEFSDGVWRSIGSSSLWRCEAVDVDFRTALIVTDAVLTPESRIVASSARMTFTADTRPCNPSISVSFQLSGGSS